jgi:type VI secretion system protein ImpC
VVSGQHSSGDDTLSEPEIHRRERDVKFQIDLGKAPAGARREAEQPFEILVMGALSGDAPAATAHSRLVARAVDIDNFDAVLAGLRPRLALELPSFEGALGGARVQLEFGSLDDFHPDAIFRRCALFAALKERRARLADAATFRQTAAEMLETAKHEPPGGTPAAATPLPDAEGAMFERLLGAGRSAAAAAPAAAAPATQAAAIQKLISRVVAPHIVQDVAPEQQRYIAAVDHTLSALMRAILHAPAFQALEAAWRALRALIDEAGAGEEVKVFVLDLSRERALEEIARGAESLTASPLYAALVGRGEQSADARPWSVIVGDYAFGPAEDDLRLLAVLGSLARRAGAGFVAAARPSLAGCGSFAAPPDLAAAGLEARDAGAWRALRAQPFAASVALAAPRTLARLPYGRAFDAIDSFAFEELEAKSGHETLLWANAGFALARLLVRSFLEDGWQMHAGSQLEIDDLPAVVRHDGDARALQPCAESYLPERAAEKLLALGLVPLQSHEKRAAVRVMRLQSIADPPAGLAGPWQ